MSLSVALSARPTPLHTQHQRPPLERATTAPARPGLPRRSSSLHKALLTRLRPLPFQYIFSLWHTKSPSPSYSSSTTAPPSTSSSTNANPTDYSPTLLVSEVPDIATFYRIFNNVPWPNIRARDSIHFFRSGVRPLWEDEENLEGGCWVLKLRREDERGLDRAVRAWEEICVMCLGGMVQAEIATERDHILGLFYSPRLYYAHISIWTKQGSNTRSIKILENAFLTGLSEDLRPKRTWKEECYYKRHEDHEGWGEVVGKTERQR